MDFSGRRDIKALQEKYGANQKNIFKVILTDKKRAIAFQVGDGVVDYELKNAGEMEADMTLYMTADTLLNLLAGRIKVMDHSTGKKVYQPYTYADCVRWGDVSWEGDGGSNHNRLAMQFFGDTLQDMQNELYPEIQNQLEVE